MSEHSFSSVRLSSQGVFIRGIPFPLFSRVFVDWADVQHVELVECSVWHRFHVMGPDLFWRWWTLDPLCLLRRKALIVKLRGSVCGIQEFALRGKEIEAAYEFACSSLSKAK